MTPARLEFEGLTNDQLLDEVRRLALRERVATADLLRCLIEVDTRRLYLREGCASLFTYCTQVLHLAEGAAYNRIEAARAARRFPLVLERIADAGTNDKLRRARDLLRHTIPDGDIAAILDRALTVLLADVEKRRCGAATRPRQDAEPAGHTRHIPSAVKREVWHRDEGRCAFVRGTRRCAETAFLEFHHVVPYADGGAATVRNIELRCRAHNQYEAVLFFGDGSDAAREQRVVW
jgi:hypothetical protein